MGICGSREAKQDKYDMNPLPAKQNSNGENVNGGSKPTLPEGNSKVGGYDMRDPKNSNPPLPGKDGGEYRLRFFDRIRQLSGLKPNFAKHDPKVVAQALKELESDIWEENLTQEGKNQQAGQMPTQSEPDKRPEEPKPTNEHKPVSLIANSGSPPPPVNQHSQAEPLAANQVTVVPGASSRLNGPNKPNDDGAGSVGSIKQDLVDKEVVQVDPKSEVRDIEGGRAHSGHEPQAAQTKQQMPISPTTMSKIPPGGYTSVLLSGMDEYKKIIMSAAQIVLKEEGFLQVTEKFKTYAPSLQIGKELRKIVRCYLRKQLTPLFAKIQQSNVSSASLVFSNIDEKHFVKKVLDELQDHLKPFYASQNEQETAGRLVEMRMQLEKNVHEKEMLLFGNASEEGEQDPFGTIMPEPVRTNTNTNQPPAGPNTDPSMT